MSLGLLKPSEESIDAADGLAASIKREVEFVNGRKDEDDLGAFSMSSFWLLEADADVEVDGRRARTAPVINMKKDDFMTNLIGF